jgi:hypothetical protein
MRVADECWLGLARLHRENPTRESFRAAEIMERIRRESETDLRPGVQVHVSHHCVANVEPNPGKYRMFLRLADNGYRLYRPGDPAHPRRTGKTKPEREDLPPEYHELLDWYDEVYCRKAVESDDRDPLLSMIGVGKHLWRDESGDDFVRRERSGWDEPSGDPQEAKGAWNGR